MLDTIAKGFQTAKNLLKKEAVLNEKNISSALNEVRSSLLEADVEYSVVKSFLAKVSEKALGLTIKTEVKDKKGKIHKLNPAEHFIRICQEELEALMEPGFTELDLSLGLNSFMMVGLQGSGKTTSSAKLARFLKEEHNKRPLLVAADIYRPGAAHQLSILGDKLGVPVFHIEGASAQEICQQGLIHAQKNNHNVIIFDTAGRLAIDEKLMTELEDIKALAKPNHIFLVVDAMIGQDALNTANEFNKRLDVNGFILTKLDGDARGGAALSIKQVTHKPILFLGMGEDLKSLEPFRPSGLASRILGMGDIVSLAKDFERHVDEKDAEDDMKKIMRGSFSLDDFLKQLNLIRKIGSFKSIIERIPGMRDMMPAGLNVDERDFTKFESMIFSMTKQERKNPELLKKQESRRKRIALGSGRKVAEIDLLIERFLMMRQMMQSFGTNPSMLSKMPMMQNQNFPSMPTMAMSTNKAKTSTKDKKDKRKMQKLARKKSKKR